MLRWRNLRSLVWALALVVGLAGLASAQYQERAGGGPAGAAGATQYWPVNENTVVDLSPTFSMTHFQYWPGGNLHHQPIIVPYHKHGPGPWASDLLLVDENTATQIDCPPHMMPTQDSGLPNAGYWGFLTCDKVPAWQFVGEVFKVDARSILDQAPNGVSPIITVDMVKAAERAWRPLRPGDVVLYWSGYDDKYDLPMPEGRRLLVDPIAGTSPAWPDPDFDTQDYIGSKGVRLVGTDSPSVGAFGKPKYSLPGPAGAFQNPLALESHRHPALGVHSRPSVTKGGEASQLPSFCSKSRLILSRRGLGILRPSSISFRVVSSNPQFLSLRLCRSPCIFFT